MEFSFTIPHKPVPKGRPRLTRRGRAYTPQRTKDYEAKVKQAYIDAEGPMFTGPVMIELSFTRECTYVVLSDDQQKSPIRGDIDNLAKSVFDGLQEVAYDNDKQIVAAYLFKEPA